MNLSASKCNNSLWCVVSWWTDPTAGMCRGGSRRMTAAGDARREYPRVREMDESGEKSQFSLVLFGFGVGESERLMSRQLARPMKCSTNTYVSNFPVLFVQFFRGLTLKQG